MPVKTKATEQAEHSWIREFLPADHAALFMQGGPMDELMWLYQVQMGGYFNLIEGIIKPNLHITTGPSARWYYLARYDQIVTILEAANVPFAKMPELTLTAKAHGCSRPECDCTPRGFREFEARVRIELYP